MDNFGRLECTKCKVRRHIDSFYILNKSVTWYILDGVPYGRPSPWCKSCQRAYMKGRYVPVAERVSVQAVESEEVTLESLMTDPVFLASDPAVRGQMLLELPPEEYAKFIQQATAADIPTPMD
jgi:hypothetical protein